jgi:hypothetical protein
MRLAFRENIHASLVSLTSLARREKCDMLSSLRVSLLGDSQTSKVIIHNEKFVLDSKFSQDSLKTPEIKLVMVLASLATKFREKRVLLRISFCETRKKRFSLRNFVARLAFHDSRYEISFCETHEKRVSLLILTRESCENFGSKKRVSLLARI